MKSRSNIIGTYLRTKREAVGALQRDVAKHAGVAPSTISRIENGDIMPTVDVLVCIGQHLDVDLTELLAQLGDHSRRELPDLVTYLREKYDLSEEAIDSMSAHFHQVTELPEDRDDRIKGGKTA